MAMPQREEIRLIDVAVTDAGVGRCSRHCLSAAFALRRKCR